MSAIDTFTITVNPPSPLPVTQEVNILWDSLPESIEEGVIPTGEYTVYWYTDTTIVDTTGLTRPPVQGFPAKLDTLNTYIYWVKQVSKAGCSSPFNEVTVNVWYAYPPAVSDTVVCKDEPVDLNDLAKADDGYTLQWYTDNEAPKGTGSIEAPVCRKPKSSHIVIQH